MDGVALLEFFLRGSVFVDEAGDPRLRAGILVRLANAVEDVRGGEAANGDVEAELLSESHRLANNCMNWRAIEARCRVQGRPAGVGAYADAFVHGLSVSGAGAKTTGRLLRGQPPS